MEKRRKVNCIIDSDPGVDDAAAIVLSLYDQVMDIKLITTVAGNRDIDTVTRNMLYLLEKFNRTDIPVAKGCARPMDKKRKSLDASFIHQKEGLGGHIPPKEVKTQPIAKHAVEAMYDTILANEGNISIVELGPHTNLGTLIKKHPDVVKKIDCIYTEGCSPYGWKKQGNWKNYISFNASSDPEALKTVIESGIPIIFVPSRLGREFANFNEKEVYDIKEINDTGKFIFEMYNGYWEHNYPDRRIATNDTCACLTLRFPELFKTKRVDMKVDINEQPGKTVVTFNRDGHIRFVMKVNKKKMHKYFMNAICKMSRFKLYSKSGARMKTKIEKSIKP